MSRQAASIDPDFEMYKNAMVAPFIWHLRILSTAEPRQIARLSYVLDQPSDELTNIGEAGEQMGSLCLERKVLISSS